ncbi:neprilysin-like [Rhipicephalus sanguineus]|uniref:neprilysin-like n=1 Tax=Rhipicephalus sanguineus TaxID=34632 RepID=UPI0020C5352D|nr:neprilysin-like [Rhipicephalus sanguineus]
MAVILALVLFALYRMYKTGGREADLCGTADCIEHVHTLGIYTDHNASPCECFGCFVCSGWSNDFRHANSSVRGQAILRWFATVNKLSLGDYDQQAVINRPLSMMRQCMSSTSDGENTVRMLTAFVSERSFAWPTAGEPEEIVDYGRALQVVLELSVVWALPLWFHVHLLPVAASSRLQRDRAVLLTPSTPSLLGHFTHETISRYQDGYSIYTGFFINTVFAVRPPSESFTTFLTRRSSGVQRQIFHELTSAIDSDLPQPRLVEIGSMPKLVRNLSAKDWIRALRSVYGTRASDITAKDLLLATNGGLIEAIDSIFASNTAKDIFFHTVWWFVQAVGSTISSVLRLSVDSAPEGAYFQRLVCFYHVDTTYNVLLASVNKAMLSTEARFAITNRLENIRSIVVEKLRGYSKLNAETRRALSSVVEGMCTVIWPEDDFGRPGGFEQYFGEPYNGSERGFYAEWEWSRLQMYNRDNRAAVAIGDYVAASKVFAFAGETVTAYNPLLNVISISVAALSPPFYYGEGTSAMFYSGLGFIYAEGIFRAVAMMAHLLNGGMVMASSESAVTWSFWNASWCSDVLEAERTFPWLPALDVAYTAYLRFKDEASDLRLEGLREYSPAQVFFATFCHGTCRTDSFKRKFSRTCTDATRNFGPFAEAFSCPTNATAKKCAYV